MDSNTYDKYLFNSLTSTKHIKEKTVYYDKEYLKQLLISLADNDCVDKYLIELSKNSKGTKMCSVGSSSRLCYLSAITKRIDIDELEKTDLYNDCCFPHYDGYNKTTNTFYEFKCHELCSEKHSKKLSNKYANLLNQYFGISVSKPLTELVFQDFGDFGNYNNKSIFDINFDFKQFLCHVLGILGQIDNPKKPTLEYVWIIPSKQDENDLQEFIEKVEEEIRFMFKCFSEIKINYRGSKRDIGTIVNFELTKIDIATIKDPFLENL